MLRVSKATKFCIVVCFLAITFTALKLYRRETLREYYQSIEQSSETEDEAFSSTDLEVSNTKGINNQGVLTVTGDVTNVGTHNVKKLVVTATFYGSSNEVIAKQTDTYEDIMFPNDSYHFKVTCLKSDAQSYSIEARAVLS